MSINGLALGTNNISAQLATKLDIAGGKVLQVVRATDATQRSTTSTSQVDVTGMSVTITPQKSDSTLLLIAVFNAAVVANSGTFAEASFRITDASNNILQGSTFFGLFNNTFSGADGSASAPNIIWRTATPATTSAVTYKLRFQVSGANMTAFVQNSQTEGQMYAIEVSA